MACAKPTHLPPSARTRTHTHVRVYKHEEYYLEKGVYRTRLQCRDCRAPAAAISVHVHRPWTQKPAVFGSAAAFLFLEPDGECL